MSCGICVMDYTKIRRQKLVCDECKFECCSACFTQYNKSTNKEIDCMNCHKFVDVKKMRGLELSAKVVDELQKKYLSEYLFNQESQLFLRTRLLMAMNSKKKELEKQILHISPKLKTIMEKVYKEEINTMSMNNFKLCVKDCNQFIYKKTEDLYYNCGLCNHITCAFCEDSILSIDKIAEHSCKGEITKSLEIIDKETKPCPTCGVKIFKVDGCSQVMCTECNTFFDFNTGLKERDEEPRHARTYIEMISEFEKEVISKEEMECFNIIKQVDNDYDFWDKEEFKEVVRDYTPCTLWCAIMINIKNTVRRTLAEKMNKFKFNEEFRVRYVKNEITQRYFTQRILLNYFKYKDLEFLCRHLIVIYFRLKCAFNQMAGELRTDADKNKKARVDRLRKFLCTQIVDIVNGFSHIFTTKKILNDINYNNMVQYVHSVQIIAPGGLKVELGDFRSKSFAI